VAHPKEADTAALIAALQNAGVRFIVVGGAAAQLHSARARSQTSASFATRKGEHRDGARDAAECPIKVESVTIVIVSRYEHVVDS